MHDTMTQAALDCHIDQHRVEYIADLLAVCRLPSVSAQQRAIAETQGPGSKTVLPCEAMAKVDFRIVPHQNPDDLVRELKAHLAAQGFSDIEVVQHNGYRAARVDPDAPFVKLVAETAWDVYDRPPVISPTSGGSGPMADFVDCLGVPIGNVGVGYPDSGTHAPNEHIRLSDFAAGSKQTARVVLRMQELEGADESGRAR